jgi:carbamate kinase
LIDAGIIPIVAGGGGIPVVQDAQGNYHGVPAVIDKDYTSAMLAAELKADSFVMVTGVEHVALDFGKPTQRNVPQMTLQQAREYAAQGQFPAGSMGPKIGAAINFLSAMQHGEQDRTHTSAAPTGRVIITSLNKVFDAVLDGAGTHITA